jgi:hypothetical protein
MDLSLSVIIPGLSMLLLHELGAIQQQEWRFFPSWTGMSNSAAYRLFAAAHLPLIAGLLATLHLPAVQIGLALFVIGHAVAHALLRHHPHIRFSSTFSRL